MAGLGWAGCCYDAPLVVCSLHGVVMSWSDEAVIRLVVVFTQSEDGGNMMNNAPWLSKYGKGCRGENCGRGRQHENWGMGLKVFTYRIVFFNIYNRQYLNSICINKKFSSPKISMNTFLVLRNQICHHRTQKKEIPTI